MGVKEKVNGSKTVVVQARMNPDLRDDVDQIFERIGISRTEAIKVFFQQVRVHRGFPFELRIPNEEMQQTFRDTDAGKNLHSYDSEEELFKDLGL